MNAEEYFEEHHVPRHSKLIKGHGLLYQESEIPKLMEAYHQERVKSSLGDVSGTFTAEDMKNFAAKIWLTRNKDSIKPLDEELEIFCRIDR